MIKSLPFLLVPLIIYTYQSKSIASGHTEKNFPNSHLHPEPSRYSADQILNGDTPGRKSSPMVAEVHNNKGFHPDRLYHVPEPGDHPRVLFSRDDIPRLRHQIEDSEFATAIYKQMFKSKDKILSKSPWGKEAYNLLSSGEIKRFCTLWEDDRNSKGKLLSSGEGQHPFFDALLDEAFFALLDDDQKSGHKAAAAVTNYAKYLLPLVKMASQQPGADHYWLQVRKVMGDCSILGLMYDFTQPFMSEDQVLTVRKTIVAATKNRYGMGMDLPPHWVNWNFIGMGIYYPLLSLSIEGEPGYDHRIYKRGCDLARNYILYGNTENGVGKEGMGYHAKGMSNTAVFALTMANRGEVLFTLTHWRNMFEKWFMHANQPYGKEWVTSGDLGTFPPNQSLVSVASYFYPENKKIKNIKNQLSMDKMEKDKLLRYLQLLCPADLGEDKNSETSLIKQSEFQMKNTLFEEKRGLLFTRTGWEEDDLSLQVSCRNDTTWSSHDHCDRGAFYLSALGQAWAVSSMRMPQTKYLNSITIDGRGQGYFAPPGKWIDMIDDDEQTMAVLDLSYCYNWSWMSTPFMMSDEQFQKEPYLERFRERRDRLLKMDHLKWERDPSDVVKNFYEGYMAGNPRMWGSSDGWVVRAPHYPVEKAFRTIGLMRGKNPYVLIVDDIKKDDRERLYEWRMKVPYNTEVYDISKGDMILSRISPERNQSYSVYHSNYRTGMPVPKQGQPMLLVRVLQANQPKMKAFQDNLKLETVEFIKHDDSHQFAGRSMGVGKRLVIPSRSVAPDYKVFIYPFRHGENLPETQLSGDGSEVLITWNDQIDAVRFRKSDVGRTMVERKMIK